jgi:CRP-like cAMP-binding protein
MASPHYPQQNHLLAALPQEEYARLRPHLELVPLPLGHVVGQSGGKQHYVYFPTTAIASRLSVMENGETTEITMIGNEGIIGIALFMGGESPAIRTVVQSAGFAYRLKVLLLNEEFARCDALQQLLLRYTQALLTQIAQTAVCNRHHALDQQLCRWLLHTLDRSESLDLVLTQEQIANMLGVRREGVTEAAGNLRRAGLIECHRGHITVIDRAGLEERCCECYAVVKNDFNRLLPGIVVSQPHRSAVIGRPAALPLMPHQVPHQLPHQAPRQVPASVRRQPPAIGRYVVLQA